MRGRTSAEQPNFARRTTISGQQIGTVIGGAIGAYFGAGNPQAIQLGMAIGAAVGSSSDPKDCLLPSIKQCADSELCTRQPSASESP